MSFKDVVPDKRRDQHFLIDTNILRRIVDFAAIEKSEDILEIGAGPGNLTDALARKARHVYSIELDPALVTVLEERFKNRNVTIIKGNALKVDFPKFDKVVANLPYSISSDVTFKLLKHPFKIGVLMYQREFAQRMVAGVARAGLFEAFGGRAALCRRQNIDDSAAAGVLSRPPR